MKTSKNAFSATDDNEKKAVEKHFQLLNKEQKLGLAMDWTYASPQAQSFLDLVFKY